MSGDYLDFLDLKSNNIIEVRKNIDYEKFSLTKIKQDNYIQDLLINDYLN